MARYALLLGYVLALVVLAVGFLEGGGSGPCSARTQFVEDNPGAADFRAERQLLPPGRRCVALAADGTVLESHSYPELGDYALALLVLLTPLGLWEAYASRRRWLRRSIVHRRGFVPALVVGAVLSFYGWAAGYFEGGMEGVCDYPPAITGKYTTDERLLPLSQRCIALAPDGSPVATGRWFPEPVDYLWTVGLFVAPFAVWGGVVRLRLSVSGAS